MTKFIILPFIFFSVICTNCFASYPIFLEKDIRSAISTRDYYYKELNVTGILFPYNNSGDAGIDSLRSRLTEAIPDSSLPWFYFLTGLTAQKYASNSIPGYFNNALKAAGSNPAMIWALSLEFGRCGQAYWETQCLEKLQSNFLVSGVLSVPAISQPLLEKAVLAEKNKDKSSAVHYYSWASKFDQFLPWSSIGEIRCAAPSQLSTIPGKIKALFSLVLKTWPLQLSIALYATFFFKLFILFMIAGIAILLGITHVPSALHWFCELFPSVISQKMKLYFSVIIFISLISLGILPFLWILFGLVWKYCKKRDKRLVITGCLLLVLYPFSVRMEDMTRQCLSPQGTPALYYRAVTEGYDADFEKIVRKHAAIHNNDYLAYTAVAISAVKNYDFASASIAIGKARSLCDNDQAILLTDGNINYFSGNLEKAENLFMTCTRLFPDYVPALFNLGQYYLNVNKTVQGMDYLDKATKLDMERVNSFITVNDNFFSKNWPLFRQLMPPEYQSLYFWKKVFLKYCGNWDTADNLWGNAFLGIHIKAYTILFMIVLTALILIDRFVWSDKNVAKIFVCKLCGAAMCRKCKKGMVCVRCFNSVQPIRNENIRQRIIERILLKNRMMKNAGAYILDVVFPGCGMLYRYSGRAMPEFLLIITSMVYAILFTLCSISFVYPYMVAQDLLLPIYYTLPLYNVVFLARALFSIKKIRQ
jgi:hypothetical protein